MCQKTRIQAYKNKKKVYISTAMYKKTSVVGTYRKTHIHFLVSKTAIVILSSNMIM